MAEAILYSFRRCPYAMRARMALAVSGIEYAHREVVLRDKPKELLDASPKGTVPVLVTECGTVIDESLAIMRWALGISDPEGWLTCDNPALIAANDGPFKRDLDRYKYASRHPGADPLEHRAAALDHLSVLEDRLSRTAYLAGSERGIADIAIFPFVRQFAATDREWFAAQALSRVQGWLEGLCESELFLSVMSKHQPWSGAAA